MTAWLLINVSLAAKQFELRGSLSLAMKLYQVFTGVYIVDYLWFEELMTTTWDIIAERFGYMLIFGDLVFIPFVFTVQLWVKDTVKTANTIVKFMRNHHATHGLMMSFNDSLSLLRPTEVRFGSVYQMLQRLADTEKVLNEMVDGGCATKWRALRWSGEKLQKKAHLVYYTLRSDSWWVIVRKIVARMDREGVSPTNLAEFDDLIARKLAKVVLTKKEREDVMDKVKDRVQMMRQPVHAAAFLLDPRRRDSGWLNDPDSALVQNAMRFFCRQIGAEWDLKLHMDMWDHLYEFLREPVEGEVRIDEHMWTPVAIKQAMRCTPADWWTLYGGDVPHLQQIAINVLGMWSTATSAEQNWASMDFVHSKRRNSLSPESLEELVYIHWNMQLLRVPNSKDNDYVDVWGSFFEPLMEPAAEDGAVEDATEDETADNIEEEKRQKRLKKTPKDRIPKSLLDDDSSGSSDLEDLVWKGKCWNESTSEESDGEDGIGEDSDFKLGGKSATRRKQLGPRLWQIGMPLWFRMCEEEARRAAVPTRKERERQSKQVSQHEEQHSDEIDERVDTMEVNEAAVRAEHEGSLQHAGVDIEALGEKKVQQEGEKSLPREGGDMKEDVEETQQQDGEELQQPAPPTVYARRPRPPALQQPAPQEPQEDQQAVAAEQREKLGSTVRGAAVHSGRPPYPAQTDDAQHNNIWKSRAGRKRKAPAWWLLQHDVELGLAHAVISVVIFIVGFIIFRGTNLQKHRFKQDPKALIWGKPPHVIGGKLLASGFWGTARHLNYLGDLLLAVSFSLPCGFSSIIPYMYPIYLFILLISRDLRDEKKCQAKYKDVWEEYCAAVPWRIFPYIY
ncbi:hypothetical protein CBR_g23124 [Chara braunii]|uniref:Delta(14)-sterol reductase n=1 Tax=Chara braunii TaxID=69332 RepID=A0A388L3N0_CHABU|nr:hypothetical protein CBR_g23124 [Chara braunii]|eukprot:GBG76910.1 hypothetical protein CBR_g23124 [Chara braunii]